MFTGTFTAPFNGEINTVQSGIGQSNTSSVIVQPKLSIIDCLSSKASQYGKPSAPRVTPGVSVCSDQAIKVLS